MAKVTIGKVEYEIPPLNFKGIKKVWPHVASLIAGGEELELADSLKVIDVTIVAIAAAFERTHPDRTVDWIEENLEAGEIAELQHVLKALLRDSGLIKDGVAEAGDAVADQGAAISTETSTL